MSCSVGYRCSSDLALLWLWHRPAAIAPIRPLAWETLYAAGMSLKRQKKIKNSIRRDSQELSVVEWTSFWWSICTFLPWIAKNLCFPNSLALRLPDRFSHKKQSRKSKVERGETRTFPPTFFVFWGVSCKVPVLPSMFPAASRQPGCKFRQASAAGFSWHHFLTALGVLMPLFFINLGLSHLSLCINNSLH